jgi:hypothetical protein
MSFGQERSWQDLMADPSVPIMEVREAFQEAWHSKEIVKGQGYKQFKRWEYFMEQRTYPTGERFAPDAVYREMQENPEMFKSQNMPGNWTYIGNTSVPSGGGAGRINSIRNLPGSSSTWFACAPAGGLWKTTNSGTSWTLLNTDELASIGVSDVAIDPTNTNILYIATSDGDAGDTYSIGVLKSTDGGNTWNTTGLNWTVTQTRVINRILINPNNTQHVITVTSNGIYRTTNGGTSWTLVQSGNFKDLKMKPGDSTTWYATGNSDDFFRSTDSGATWTQIVSALPTSGVTRMSLAVSAANPAYVYIIAGNNSDYGLQGIYRSTDSGTTWVQQADNTPNYLTWDENGAGGGGQAWYDLSIECDQSNANTLYIGGVNLWKSTNGGTSFTCVGHWYGAAGIPYVHADIHALHWVSGASGTLLVGNDGGVFRTSDNGATFTDNSSNLEIAQQYRLSVAGTNSNRVITGWQDNGTNLKDGVAWSEVIGGDGMECIIDPTNQNIMYGELYYGAIFKSTTGGGGFSQIVGNNGSGVNEGGAWVTPYVLGTNPNHLFVGKSTVYKSTNGGSSFSAMSAFGSGSINSLAVAPSNNDVIYASKGGSLYRTTNGNTFTLLNDFSLLPDDLSGLYITYIAVHPTNPDKVWVTYSGFDSAEKVDYSSNGGTTWTSVSTGLPNLPVNCIVYQNGTNDGLYIGTDAGVYYRDNTVGTWIPYMDGLPNVVVSELEIHYPTGTITAATYGRGLWRGQLYTLPNLDATMVQVISPAGTSCATSVTPSLQISNAGNATLTSLAIQYQVTGQSAQTYNWTGNLATGASATITLPSLDYGAGTFNITFSFTSINGLATDDNAANNSISSGYSVTGGTNDVTLTLSTDCWGSETSWTLTDGGGNTLYSGGPYASTSTITVPMCLPDGCFSFNIFDSFGDGLGGTAFGCGVDGNYFITDDNSGALLVEMTNANFGTGAVHSFCVPFVAVYGCTDPLASNYDPAANIDNGSCVYACLTYQLTLLTDCWGEEVSWNITDDLGNILYSQAGGQLADQTTFNVPVCLNLGCYTFNIFDSFGDGLSGIASGCPIDGNYFMTDNLGNIVFQMAVPNYGTGTSHSFCVGVPGCTNPLACNYNELANFDDGTCVVGPSNDVCSNAIELVANGSPVLADNSATCIDGPNPNCGNNGAAQMRDLWYKFTYTGGTVTIQTAVGTNTDTRIAVYSSCGGALLDCDDDDGTGLASLITLGCPTLTVGNTYYIQAGGWADQIGNFTIWYNTSSILGCTNPIATNYNACATQDDGSCLINGCTDATACNYDPIATVNDGTCEYPGCTNPVACNYNALAGCDNGSCTFPGCNNPGACNYDALAGCDDGSCTFPGCTNPVACNYDALAGCDDGSCSFPGCTDNSACNYDALAGCDDGSCTFPGCIDVTACNYDSQAGCSDGSCTYPGCTNPLACNYDMNAGCDDGTCYLPALFFADMDGDGYGDPNTPLAGCTQPPMSSLDNTDCDDTRADVYPGAPGTAEDIDNNCSGALEAGEFSGCPGDFDNSGNINTVDLLIFLSDYSCSSGCVADLNGDDIVGTADLLFFLGVFGTNCP